MYVYTLYPIPVHPYVGLCIYRGYMQLKMYCDVLVGIMGGCQKSGRILGALKANRCSVCTNKDCRRLTLGLSSTHIVSVA